MSKPLLLLLAALSAWCQDPRAIVEELQRRARADSQRYEGTLEVFDSRSRVTTKRWQYQRLGSFGDSKAVLRFTAPPEVKGVALLVFNHKQRASDMWMWTPALQRDRRIALQDRSTRFFGTDFSFEDLEERDVDHYDYRLLGDEKIDGHDCWKIESRPKGERRSQYTHSHVWIRKDIYVSARIEGFRDGKLLRRIHYRDHAAVDRIWSARSMEVFDASRNSRTVMRLEKLEYNLALPAEDFTLQALRRGQ